METEKDTFAAGVDGLYGLAPDEFTGARDELARRLRGEGDRDAANDVKRLRKPSLIAWGLNQVHRDDPRAVEGLIEASTCLREGTERLLAGQRAPFERASAEHRRLVEELASQAELKLTRAGHAVNTGVQNKLRATLRAVAADAQASRLLSAGRLIRDYEVSDLGFATVPVPPAAGHRTASAKTRSQKTASAAAAREARKRQGLRKRLETARARRVELEDRARGAQRRVQYARQAAARAMAARERAEASAEQARASAQEAADRVAQLKTSLRELEPGG